MKNRLNRPLIVALCVLLLSISACTRDNKLRTVKIGTQEWTAENLSVDRFRNGDRIPEVKTSAEWEKAGKNKQAAWCYYDNDKTNEKKFGKLYNYYAVIDPRGLAPEGWHLPSMKEWTVLIEFLGDGKNTSGIKLKSTDGWRPEYSLDGKGIRDGNGTDESGFTAYPGGYRFDGGPFFGKDGTCYWWCADNFKGSCPSVCHLGSETGGVYLSIGLSYGFGCYVRLVKDSAEK